MAWSLASITLTGRPLTDVCVTPAPDPGTTGTVLGTASAAVVETSWEISKGFVKSPTSPVSSQAVSSNFSMNVNDTACCSGGSCALSSSTFARITAGLSSFQRFARYKLRKLNGIPAASGVLPSSPCTYRVMFSKGIVCGVGCEKYRYRASTRSACCGSEEASLVVERIGSFPAATTARYELRASMSCQRLYSIG